MSRTVNLSAGNLAQLYKIGKLKLFYVSFQPGFSANDNG
jgi:hypothetical protein